MQRFHETKRLKVSLRGFLWTPQNPLRSTSPRSSELHQDKIPGNQQSKLPHVACSRGWDPSIVSWFGDSPPPITKTLELSNVHLRERFSSETTCLRFLLLICISVSAYCQVQVYSKYVFRTAPERQSMGALANPHKYFYLACKILASDSSSDTGEQ